MIALIVLLSLNECATARGAWLRAGEVSAVAPEFGALPRDTKLFRAPDPGVDRRIPVAELQAIGRRHGIAVVRDGDLCVTRATRIFSGSDFNDALDQALPQDSFPFRVLEHSRGPLPEGNLLFRAPQLRVLDATEGKAHWRGALVDDAGRSFPVWAALQFTAREEYPIARRDLRHGHVLRGDDIEWKSRALLPGRSAPGGGWEGKALRRGIRAGDEIPHAALRPPPAVSAGEPVSVEVAHGAARLVLEASAETGGRPGDAVIVRNPSSGKKFRASVVGRSRVEVRLTAGQP